MARGVQTLARIAGRRFSDAGADGVVRRVGADDRIGAFGLAQVGQPAAVVVHGDLGGAGAQYARPLADLSFLFRAGRGEHTHELIRGGSGGDHLQQRGLSDGNPARRHGRDQPRTAQRGHRSGDAPGAGLCFRHHSASPAYRVPADHQSDRLGDDGNVAGHDHRPARADRYDHLPAIADFPPVRILSGRRRHLSDRRRVHPDYSPPDRALFIPLVRAKT